MGRRRRKRRRRWQRRERDGGGGGDVSLADYIVLYLQKRGTHLLEC
jgi:hypothetical protein